MDPAYTYPPPHALLFRGQPPTTVAPQATGRAASRHSARDRVRLLRLTRATHVRADAPMATLRDTVAELGYPARRRCEEFRPRHAHAAGEGLFPASSYSVLASF